VLVHVLADLGRLLLDTVAPRHCAGCDNVSPDPICPDCTAQLSAMPAPRPRRLTHGTAYAGFEFDDLVRSILHHGKYGSDHGALRAIAALASQRVRSGLQSSTHPAFGVPLSTRGGYAPRPDAIVAVPLGPRRRRQRGYNQADIVARVFAEANKAPVLDGLHRIRETTPQSARDEPGRRRNVAGAFAWNGSALDQTRVWLVDDVLTTGATAEAAGAALIAAGASRVDVVIVAEVP
jgi:ComF family protein